MEQSTRIILLASARLTNRKFPTICYPKLVKLVDHSKCCWLPCLPKQSPLRLARCFSSNADRNKPPHPNNNNNRVVASVTGVGSAALLLAGKGKYLLGALKLTKFASLGSMVLTIGTYSMFFGAPYAIGVVGLIAVHESGHALVMHRLNIPFSPMIFIPFLGASIAMKSQPKDAYTEALVAFGGPVVGTAGAMAVHAMAYATDSQLCYALTEFGYFVNLMNLLPIGTMDGGRICGAVSPYSGLLGLGAGGALIYNGIIEHPLFYLVMISGAWSTFSRFYYKDSTPPNYYRITPMQKSMVTVGYFFIVGFLMTLMSFNSERFKRIKSPKLLEQEQRQHEKWDFGFQN